jgi:glycosyltransferase involved in cell wall biosynthesis
MLKKKEIKLSNDLFKIINEKKFFLSIGRFTKQKNFLFYLKCIPEILQLDEDLFFLFIGHGEDKKKFMNISKKLNISNRILVIEHIENVHYFMQKAYALILPSLWEDPGFVLIEAGFNNCQVISSNCPNGPSEIIKNDGGYLFESNIKKSLIKTINTFLYETKNKRMLKKTKLKKRLKKFTFFYHALTLKKLIEDRN